MMRAKHVGAYRKRAALCWILLSVGAHLAAATGGSPALLDAVKRGNHAAIRTLLQQVDANAAEPDGTTALHLAVLHDDAGSVELLLGAGANVQAANRYGVTPLMIASTNGNASIIERLLDAGADPDTATSEGETVLMTAARTGNVAAVRALLSRSATVGATEQWRGQTALMWAAAENHASTVKALLDAGADLKVRSNGGFTALLFAVRSGARDAVNVLLDAGADVNDAIDAPPRRGSAMTSSAPAPAAPARSTQSGAAALGARANAGSNDPSVDRLLQAFNTGSRATRGDGPNGTSALVLAITNAHFELAGLLLDRGADPNAGRQGWSPLHQIALTRKYPIQHGLPPPVPTGNLSSLELARKLLEHGANVDARMTKEPADGARNVLDRIGSTPFLQASKLADVPYMRVLLEHGADPSIATEEGATALMAAAGVGIWQVGESAGTNEEAFEAVKLCYDVGNDVNAIDKNGDTALHGAAHRGANDIVKFLVEKGAKLNVVDKLGWTPWIIADGVFYPNTYNRRLDTAELLLKLGADPKIGKRRPEDLAPSDELQHKAPASKSRQQQH